MKKALPLLLLLVLPLFSFVLIYAPDIPEAEAVPETVAPKIEQTQDFNFRITAHEVTTSTHYVYVTPAGNYSFLIAKPWLMKYTSLLGNESASFSTFAVRQGLSILRPLTSTVVIQQTSYSVCTDLQSSSITRGQLCQTFDFTKMPPKATATWTPAEGNTNSFNILWGVASTTFGYVNTQASVTGATNTNREIQGNLGSQNRVYLMPSATSFRHFVTIDWSDYGPATVLYGKIDYNDATYYGVLVIFPLNANRIDPSIVQKSGTTCSSPNCQKSFSPDPTSGNLLVAAVAIADTTTTCGTASISDTQSNTYTSIASSTKAGATNCFFTQMWYATAGSGADQITVAYSRSLVDGASGIFIYELSGVTGTGLTSSTGSGSGSPPTLATGSVTFSSNAILIATLSIGEGTVGTMAAGTGFTLDQSANPNSNQESATSGITSPTTFPFSQSGNSGTQYFAEVGAQFPATVTQPITITIDNSGTGGTATLSGCGVSDTTQSMDGVSENHAADPSCTITVTLPSDATNTRHRTASDGTSYTIATCSSGTCSASSTTVYFELRNLYQASPVAQTTWDELTDPTVVGTIRGTASSTLCTIDLVSGGGAASTQCWGDYNRAAVIGTATLGSPPANSQWERNGACSFTQTTGGNTDNCDFYKEWSRQYAYSLTGGGTFTAPTHACNKLGVATNTALTTTLASIYCDNAATATATNPLGGSTSSQRAVTTTANPSVTSGGGSTTWVYQRQYLVTNPNSLSITRTNNGTSATITGNGFVDASTDITVVATYTQSWTITYASWIYDVTASSIGIQLLGDQALGSISYNTNNPSAPFLTFTTTSSGTEKAFIPTQASLTISRVTNAGVANTGYTIASNVLSETGASPHEIDFTSSEVANPGQGSGVTPSEETPPSGGGGGGAVLIMPPAVNIETTPPEVTSADQPTTNLGILLIIAIVSSGVLLGALREDKSDFRPPKLGGGNPFRSVGGGGGDPFASPRRRKANWRKPRR